MYLPCKGSINNKQTQRNISTATSPPSSQKSETPLCEKEKEMNLRKQLKLAL